MFVDLFIFEKKKRKKKKKREKMGGSGSKVETKEETPGLQDLINKGNNDNTHTDLESLMRDIQKESFMGGDKIDDRKFLKY